MVAKDVEPVSDGKERRLQMSPAVRNANPLNTMSQC